MEGDEAVALNDAGFLRPTLELINKRNQISAGIFPVPRQLPYRTGVLVEHGRGRTVLCCHNGIFDCVVL